MEYFFPFKERVIYANLRLTPEGLYSVTKRIEGERLIAFLHGMIPDLRKQSITDATACVGSDTLLFSLHFKKLQTSRFTKATRLVFSIGGRTFCMSTRRGADPSITGSTIWSCSWGLVVWMRGSRRF